MCEQADYVLNMLSGRGSMRWASFKNAFHTLRQESAEDLNGDSDDFEPRMILLRCVRILSELGHCDFVFSGSAKVYVAPPVLLRLPIGGRVISALAGARTRSFVERFAELARQFSVVLDVCMAASTSFGIPRCVVAEANSTDLLQRFADAAGISFVEQPPSWQIAHFSSSLDDYLNTSQWSEGTCPDWEACGYDPSKLSFTGSIDGENTLRLTRHKDRGRWRFELWKGEMRASADLDWARFAIAASRSSRLVAYDSRQCVFAVPVAAPLPPLLARAIGLCSARPATRHFAPSLALDIVGDRRVYNFYQNVPLAIAEVVASKLGQSLIHTNIQIS